MNRPRITIEIETPNGAKRFTGDIWEVALAEANARHFHLPTRIVTEDDMVETNTTDSDTCYELTPGMAQEKGAPYLLVTREGRLLYVQEIPPGAHLVGLPEGRA